MRKMILAGLAAVLLGSAVLVPQAEARCWWNGFTWQCSHPRAWWWGPRAYWWHPWHPRYYHPYAWHWRHHYPYYVYR